MWMDQKTLDAIFAFMGEGGLELAFVKMRSSSDLGIFSPVEDNKICNKYHGHAIPLHKCLFL